MASSLGTLKVELRGLIEDIENLTTQLNIEDDDDSKAQIQTRLDTAREAREEMKNTLFDLLETECKQQTITEVVLPPSPPTQAAPSTSNTSLPEPRSHLSNSHLVRLKQPKEYKSGEDFSTFSYRLRIFLECNKTDSKDYVNVLLSCVDDITLQKLMPVIDNLTNSERLDLKTLLEKCKETLYPKSEVRALRQQLTSARIVQEDGQDVEQFAAKIRSVVNRAGYTSEAEKSEACLNAFLNGLNGDIADKLFAAPGVENSFDVAVSTARKLEKMKSIRSPPINDFDNLANVLRVSSTRGSRDLSPPPPPRSGEQQELLNNVSSYRQNHRGSDQNESQRNRRNFRSQPNADRRVRIENRRCYRCHELGHIARTCPATAPSPAPLNL